MVRRWLLLFVLVTGLGDAARAEDGVVGSWSGQYVCAQGDTALTLTIRPAASAGEVTALFHFQSSPSNPGVPEGCFTMSGSYDGDSRRTQLTADSWLLRPEDYVMVDLVGQLDPDGSRLSGRVVGPFCSTFELHRVSAPPAATGCRDPAIVSQRQGGARRTVRTTRTESPASPASLATGGMGAAGRAARSAM